MTNMSYCRLENTYDDLRDCYDHMHDVEDLSESEEDYRERMIKLCQEIVRYYHVFPDEWGGE